MAIVGVLWVFFAFVNYSKEGSVPGVVIGVRVLPEILDKVDVVIKGAGQEVFIILAVSPDCLRLLS